MTSYKLKSKFSNLKQSDVAAADTKHNPTDHLLRMRVNNSSGSSTMSTSSDSSSNSNSILNEALNIKITFPNGVETVKKIEPKKAIYDLLIELSASARLIPTNYTLKLYSQDENTNINVDVDDKLIEYTPNQTIGQLNPTKIKIVPKTATLKHQHVLQESNKVNSNALLQHSISTKQQPQPFELTTCVQVNLPFNQKTIVRAKRDIKLNDLFELICKEANLEQNKYDLIVSNHTSLSMQDSFAMFNSKEVSLVLKKQEQLEQSKLNSKSTHSIFVQNPNNTTKKSKNITVVTHQNQTLTDIHKLRSKSEIDFKLAETKETSSKTSTMFGIFSRNKKTTDTNKSVAQPKPDSETVKQQENIITPSCLTAKKKPAPPPPSHLVTTSDEVSISRLMNSTKKKAPAPPPPQIPTFQPPPVPEPQTENIEATYVDSPKSNHSSDYSVSSNQTDHKTSSSASLPLPDSYSVPSSPASSSASSEKKDDLVGNSLIMSVVKTHIHYNNLGHKYHSVQTYSSPLSSPTFQTKQNDTLKEVETKIIARKLSMQSTSSDIEDSLENSVTSGNSSKLDNQHTNEIESIAEIDDSIDSMTNNLDKDKKLNLINDLSIHSSSTSIYKVDKSNDESLLVATMRGKFYGKVSDQKTFSEDDFSDLESIKTPNSPMPNNRGNSSNTLSRYQQYLNKNTTINQNSLDNSTKTKDLNNNLNETLKYEENKIQIKKAVATEVRPEFTTSLLSYVNTVEPNEYVKVKPLKEINQSIKTQFIRSPSSPLPQFPAIGENEMNEQHQNYTVVKSGEIIEKNGTYYSTDGTVRGYSGTVKKIANSKTLNEIFNKQQELEQQHEREYQVELEKKQKQDEEQQKKMNSLERNKVINVAKRQSLPYQAQNNYTKGRTSLGNIIMNVKNANFKSNTLSSYANIFKQPANKLSDNELSKKLEERANKIEAATNKPLRIDTNLKELTSNLNSTISSSSSSNSYNNTTASYTNQASSSSTNASSTILSPRSPTTNRVGYTKIYDLKNESLKNHESTSSSSSLSTFSYELYSNKPFQANLKPVVKSNQNTLSKKTPSIDYHTMLLNEIKSVVPLVQDINNTKSEGLIKLAEPVGVPVNKPPPPPANPPQVFPKNEPKTAPFVASKNFSKETIQSLNKKNQVIDDRDSLLDSIKSFSVSSLRKVDSK